MQRLCKSRADATRNDLGTFTPRAVTHLALAHDLASPCSLPEIVSFKRMTSLAMRLPLPESTSEQRTADVLFPGYCLEVVGVDTCRCEAKVVNLEAFGDGAYELGICPSVGAPVLVLDLEHSVPVLADTAEPQPTSTWLDGNFGEEAFFSSSATKRTSGHEADV